MFEKLGDGINSVHSGGLFNVLGDKGKEIFSTIHDPLDLFGGRAKKIRDAEAERRALDKQRVLNDLKPLSAYNDRLFKEQQGGYFNSTEGKALSSELNKNQSKQLGQLNNMNLSDEQRLSGVDSINKSTADGMSSLAMNSTQWRNNLNSRRYRGISDYIGQKWNAINRANALTSQNAQNLQAQNAANSQAAVQFGSSLAGAFGGGGQ